MTVSCATCGGAGVIHEWERGEGPISRASFRRERPCPACLPPGDARTILVGEGNPYSGADPRYALYPEPAYSAGGRLCRLVLGLEPREYLRRYDRRNLCADKWRIVEARAAAAKIREELEARALKEPRGQHRGVAVLLGAKVCAAFGVEFRPFTILPLLRFQFFVILPHPSGLSRLWDEPGSFEKARELLRHVGAL